MTVMTLGQTIWREVEAEGCELIVRGPVVGGNLSENAARGKRQWTTKAASRVISFDALRIAAKMCGNV
ncbi:MAG: hypothetical protein NTAFB05_01540 [Nitrobacter sp.]